MKKLLTLFVLAVMAVASYAQQPGDKVDIMGRFGYCWGADDGESFTFENGVITFNSASWKGLAAWIGGEDWSGYSKLVFEYAEPTTVATQIQLQTTAGNFTSWNNTGVTSVELSFEDLDVTGVNQLALQASDPATIVITAAYLVVGEKKDVDYSDYTELITNGDCEGDDVSNFVSKEWTTEEQYWGPARIVVDPTNENNNCIEVVSRDIPEGQEKIEDWDAQFFITTTEKFEPGDKYHITFKVRAEKAASAQTQAHNTPGDYNHYEMLGNITFSNEWVEIEKKGTISEAQVYGADNPNYNKEMHTIAFNLAVLKEANKYYFDDISVQIFKPQEETYEDYTDLITNGNCEGDETTNYVSKEFFTGEEVWGPSRLVTDPTDASNKCIEVVSRDIPEGEESITDWDSQFFITVADKLQPGDEYFISFKVRADKAATGQSQAHNQPGQYNHYEMLGNISFSNEWVEIKKTGTITETQVYKGGDDYDPNNEMHTIAFNLAVLKEANKYYFDDIVFKVKKAPVEKLIGDANGDGQVNITDVSVAVDYVLTKNTEFIVIENADINEDGEVNITDISGIVNIVLGKE